VIGRIPPWILGSKFSLIYKESLFGQEVAMLEALAFGGSKKEPLVVVNNVMHPHGFMYLRVHSNS